MSAVHCCRMSWMAAGVVLLLSAYQSAPLQAQERPAPSIPAMERVRLSEDGTEFILAESGTKFVPWGFYFVQRISNEPKNRESRAIAEAWVEKMVKAIRKHDRDALVTVGVIPWAQVWPNAKPLFYSPEVARHLDFVSVHFYPKKGEGEKTLTALAVYDIGKPLVVEETFPLSCSLEELDQFIEGAGARVDGWISHYFGNSIEEHAAGAKPSGELTAKFLQYWQNKGAEIRARAE